MTEPSPDLESLIDAWRRGSLDEAGTAALTQLLLDPATRAEARRLRDEAAGLQVLLDSQPAAERLEALRRAVPAPKVLRPPRRIWLPLMATAAAALVLVVLLWRSEPAPSVPTQAITVDPRTTVLRAGHRLELPPGTPLFAADRISADTEGVVLALAEGRIELRDGDLVLGAGVEHHLESGVAHCRIAPRPLDAPPFAIRTAHLTATVTGTMFTVSADTQRSRVLVVEGSVAVAGSTGTPVALVAGEQALGLGGAIQVQQPGVVFSWSAAEPTPGILRVGELRQVSGHAAVHGGGDPNRPGHPILVIDLAAAPLWTVSGDEVIEITYRCAEVPSWIGLYVQTGQQGKDSDHALNWKDPAAGAWRTRRLPLSRIHSSRGDPVVSSLTPGDAVVLLRFQADPSAGDLELSTVRVLRPGVAR